MDHLSVAESIARQLAHIWTIHRTPAFVDYLRQTFGCEPLEPVKFAGYFSVQMQGRYFFPDFPAGPGPVIEAVWLMDDTGFRPSNLAEWLPVVELESDNPLVVYAPSRWPRWLKRASWKPIGLQPYLCVYPCFRFSVWDNKIIYYEQYGVFAGCSKVGKLVISDRVAIQDVCMTTTTWQGRYQDLA